MCNETLTLLLECGFTKPPITVLLLDKPAIVKAVALHYLILKSKAEIDQLKKGLATLGVLNAIELHPLLFEPLFVASRQTALTPGVCVCACVHACMLCARVYVCLRACISVCECMCLYAVVCVCVCASVFMYIHIYLCILFFYRSLSFGEECITRMRDLTGGIRKRQHTSNSLTFLRNAQVSIP